MTIEMTEGTRLSTGRCQRTHGGNVSEGIWRLLACSLFDRDEWKLRIGGNQLTLVYLDVCVVVVLCYGVIC